MVSITMPAVFLGAYIGVSLNHMLAEWGKEQKARGEENSGVLIQMCLFAVVVAWSIKTTAQKACELIKKEKQERNLLPSTLNASLQDPEASIVQNDAEEDEQIVQSETPELLAILHEEKHHFTKKRVVFTLCCFLVLFLTQALAPKVTGLFKYVIICFFVVSSGLLTVYAVNNLNYINTIKERDGYKFHKNDLRLKTKGDII
jgi:hypothetical protein